VLARLGCGKYVLDVNSIGAGHVYHLDAVVIEELVK
jgi:hypothetical protein